MQIKKQQQKHRRLMLIVCLAPILILCVTIAVVHINRSSEFDHRIKELSKAGFPVSLDDLEERYVLPEGVENAADLYVKAFDAYVEPTEEQRQFLPSRGLYRRKDKSHPLPPEVLNAIESSLQSNRKTLALIDKAAKMEHCLFPRTRYTYSFMTDDFNRIKKSAQLLNERNLHLASNGQTDLLFQSLKTTFAQTYCLSQQPLGIEYILMTALRGMAVNSLEDSLNFAEFTDGQLSYLHRKVRDMRQSDILASTLVNERVYIIDCLELPPGEQIDILKSQFTGIDPNSIGAIGENDAVMIFDYYDDMTEAASLPPAEHLKRTDQIFNNLDLQGETQFAITTRVDSMMMDVKAIYTGSLLCAETALAIERYRLRQGNYPQLLQQLVPDFLDEIPIEPFDGKPIRYRQLGHTGYTLYAIGMDRQDNNGLNREQITKTTGESPDESDWPFTVNRRQSP